MNRKLSIILCVFSLLIAYSGDLWALGRLGDGKIALYRPDKNEGATFVYRDKNGNPDPKVFNEIAYFFRCRLTNETHPIDPKLIETLDAIEDHFGNREILLISQYRSPTRNNLMRKEGRGVAKNSLHMQGMAADIEIAGIPADLIRDYAYSLHAGGIGYYGKRSFVHVDSGRMRTWGWQPAQNSRIAAANK